MLLRSGCCNCCCCLPTLSRAVKNIPVGLAYATWSGTGDSGGVDLNGILRSASVSAAIIGIAVIATASLS